MAAYDPGGDVHSATTNAIYQKIRLTTQVQSNIFTFCGQVIYNSQYVDQSFLILNSLYNPWQVINFHNTFFSMIQFYLDSLRKFYLYLLPIFYIYLTISWILLLFLKLLTFFLLVFQLFITFLCRVAIILIVYHFYQNFSNRYFFHPPQFHFHFKYFQVICFNCCHLMISCPSEDGN